MGEIRVAIAGLGNCASALVQGVEYYRRQREGEVPGLMHVNFGGYYVDDIKFVAAFDVSSLKVGRDISEAIHAEPNCCARFSDVPPLGVKVLLGPVSDGAAPHMFGPFHVEDGVEPVDVAEALRESEAGMLINYLPVGSSRGTRRYAEAAIEAGCAFVNCIPEFIASDGAWGSRFEGAGLPVAGDDIKSQVGATILHRALAELFYERGVRIDAMYQLNIGGNTDFLNMTVEERLHTKRVSKTEAVKSLLPYDVPTRIGPSDYVPFLGDDKIGYITINGQGFGNLPIRLSAKLEVRDSPNSAGVVIDVVRAIKLARDRGISGPLTSISSYAFKHPPVQVSDDVARGWVEDFIEGKRKR
ncbi:MAG: inositol-3-phosphate synthase [Candidatus Bathyarchaeota archaeon]|nr:inositol-3-phosphate synthase [Candidatus Bathyarchaeota archaeon]